MCSVSVLFIDQMYLHKQTKCEQLKGDAFSCLWPPSEPGLCLYLPCQPCFIPKGKIKGLRSLCSDCHPGICPLVISSTIKLCLRRDWILHFYPQIQYGLSPLYFPPKPPQEVLSKLPPVSKASLSAHSQAKMRGDHLYLESRNFPWINLSKI